MTERELFLSCCGTDEKGFAKASTLLSLGILNMTAGVEKAEQEEFDKFFTQNGVINIERTMFHTKIDVTFEDNSEELKEVWQKICSFRNFAQRAELPEDKIENMVLTIQPSVDSDYYIQAAYGICSLTATDIEKPCDTLTFIFSNEFVKCYYFEG